MMVEVFKTNVKRRAHAKMLVEQIHGSFQDYRANFDLDDRDRILRVKSTNGRVHSHALTALLHKFGFEAEVLPDNPPLPSMILSARIPSY